MTPAGGGSDVESPMAREPDRPEPTVPLEVVRDLLAITRALYRVETDPVRLEELRAIGEGFRTALRLAPLGKGALGGRAAPGHAEKATARLCALVDESTRLEPALRALADKVTR